MASRDAACCFLSKGLKGDSPDEYFLLLDLLSYTGADINIYIYISLVKRYTVIILSRYAVLQLVLLRSSEKYFYRYPRNMSIARIFHFALIVVTVRGKYQNILLLLRVYNLRVCFCSTNKIQLVLFQNIDHFKKLSSQEEPVYRESRAKTRLKTAACC